jgi:glutathione S-transferase
VPALVTEEGPVLTDNAAIAAYLEARYPEPPLLGARRWTRPRSPAGSGASSSRA